MTLPSDEVLELLDERFVLGHRNIERESHVGMSSGYKPTHSAVGTTNGAGGRNVQFLVLAADGTLVHALPGFWHAEDLLRELELGLELHRLYLHEGLRERDKLALFRAMHERHLRRHLDDAERRGGWQSFDRRAELDRAASEPRDTVVVDEEGLATLKSIPRIVHERLLRRPFPPLDEFDVEAFVDYGRAHYDNNRGIDDGRPFAAAVRANEKRERELQRQREREQKEREKRERDEARQQRRR